MSWTGVAWDGRTPTGIEEMGTVKRIIFPFSFVAVLLVVTIVVVCPLPTVAGRERQRRAAGDSSQETYEGRAADATWRQAANRRIDTGLSWGTMK